MSRASPVNRAEICHENRLGRKLMVEPTLWRLHIYTSLLNIYFTFLSILFWSHGKMLIKRVSPVWREIYDLRNSWLLLLCSCANIRKLSLAHEFRKRLIWNNTWSFPVVVFPYFLQKLQKSLLGTLAYPKSIFRSGVSLRCPLKSGLAENTAGGNFFV